ncbi:hypothetical protein PsorP6_012654 [Peronosclerospora sorghi]|uniref:Uncharacterized protein n=1 Tax=Peronosclerospora sorghi TaxID=230839 RepID=A0ACC0WJF7_9STRA|nr:hypothetical protein PsorP6_012654 [Peronosclerospora sorghi]
MMHCHVINQRKDEQRTIWDDQNGIKNADFMEVDTVCIKELGNIYAEELEKKLQYSPHTENVRTEDLRLVVQRLFSVENIKRSRNIISKNPSLDDQKVERVAVGSIYDTIMGDSKKNVSGLTLNI